MKQLTFWALLLTVLWSSCSAPQREKNVLLFSHTQGYRHQSIEAGIEAIEKLGQENGWTVVATEDPTQITEEVLRDFSAVIFLNTTQDILDNAQQADFERFIQAGGGFVGIHAAADTEYDWPWYGELVGGWFKSHPRTQEATLEVVDDSHPASQKAGLGKVTRTDEWYDYKNFDKEKVNVLMVLDESSYEDGGMGDYHPLVWYHEFDGGRAFYTGMGHTPESFEEAFFLDHLKGGIEWAIGDDQLDYARAHTLRVPFENRFVKTVLVSNLNEPMEFDFLPDGRAIIVERKGAIRIWDPQSNATDSLTSIPVWDEFEDGLMGVAVAPDYPESKWVYVYYAPPGEESINQISRFKFDGTTWDFASEQVIMKVETQRVTCCHSGGSLEFDRHGNLFLSTGDDTNPFASDGFAPIDEQSGREPWDAQRTSSNTNDLRGKILRIHPEPDGSYTIPEGNLFPEGTPDTRPEIFVMGCRNPFRISIDQKRDWLYWGDVGPDAGKDGEMRGPKGYDEINLAKKAGYYGWPYFRGDGKAYNDYDFAKKQSGEPFNPENPINDSPNNTGLQELPPFTPSLIWYSYDESEEFPWVKTGGKNPMAGPVYYQDQFAGVENRYPEYFDGKLFIYEWMRNWIFVIHQDEEGKFIQADPFVPNMEFSRPMDMVFGPDGALYVLEYGQTWFARNQDARLSRVEYVSGNRAPIARITADKPAGAAPLTVAFSAEKSEDLDREGLTYAWTFEGDAVQERTADASYTFEQAGIYPVKLQVTDESGNTDETTVEIQVGNEAPQIVWKLDGNQSFYWDKATIDYEVAVTDKEDGSLADGSLDASRVKVSIDYLPEGYDVVEMAMGHQTADDQPMGAFAKGQQLIDGSDCKACHAVDRKVNGPSYLEIAERYAEEDGATAYLAEKIIKGGGGKWGETVMSAHPQLTLEQTTTIAEYILSLAGDGEGQSTFPAKGAFVTNLHDKDNKEGAYILLATYADKGNGAIQSITSQEMLVLRYPKLEAERYDQKSNGTKIGSVRDRNDGMVDLTNNQYIAFEGIDLTGVQEITLLAQVKGSGKVELHLDGNEGKLAGSASLTVTEGDELQTFTITPEATGGKHDLYFVFKNAGDNQVNAALDRVNFSPGSSLLSAK
ncbi:ThuA domain-containing protein [Flavilitoribacter nigricans]|uniref:Carbohydrate-binding protein n=1 Tax=Flavilitoribacter nigricans (strain ATCC 23147 / DSM 23189 / NBRC 102662 / NCIMB 1420 / SS-2) TaxID=1122177 RepID=A0A2D0N0V0_FLAN2|nr:ThuA domain-containing protein [Flavilitoribacter nigricans]PHN02087.1 hypothetical protein CRP01_34210 [Flavilitoribacter nigricans DSM 23189 = NBRC 102662]